MLPTVFSQIEAALEQKPHVSLLKIIEAAVPIQENTVYTLLFSETCKKNLMDKIPQRIPVQ